MPIGELFFDDAGPHVVTQAPNPPTRPAERFRLEVVSQAEHSRRGRRAAGGARCRGALAAELRAALRALGSAARSFGQRRVAEFAREWLDRAHQPDAATLRALDAAAALLTNPTTRNETVERGLEGSPPAARRALIAVAQKPVDEAPRRGGRPRTPTGDQLVRYLDQGLAGLGSLEERPLSARVPVPEERIVPITDLLYRGRGALQRAVELREEVRDGRTPTVDTMQQPWDLLSGSRRRSPMKFRWRDLFGIVLSGVLIVLTLAKVDRAQVLTNLRHANPFMLVAAAAVATSMFPLRARRWRTILDRVAHHLPFAMLWRATAAGMMVNNVFPARAGELARAYALTRETDRVGFSAAFASIGVDRVFDSFVLMFLRVGGDARVGCFHRTTLVAGRSIGRVVDHRRGAGGRAARGVLSHGALPRAVHPSLRVRRVGRIAPRFEAQVRGRCSRSCLGWRCSRNPARFLAILAWTTLHWLAGGLAFWLGFKAVGITNAPFSAALVVQGLIAIGVAVPSTPGFFGVFEYVATQTLPSTASIPRLAASWAISYHLVSYIPITVIGSTTSRGSACISRSCRK